MNQYQQILLHLTLIDEVGPALIERIGYHVIKTHAFKLYQFTSADFQALGLTQRQAQLITEGLKDTKTLEQELALIEKHTISLHTILDDDYPFLLKNIHLPPPVIYRQGALLSDDEQYIALVGSRKAGRYTRRLVDHVVPTLVASNWVTVSGGARGADSMVHEKTVELGGRTIVVLGSGLLKLYPPENGKLFDRVVSSGGSLVSIFPLQTDPYPHNFPARNRVIAGLSRGTVVLQAARKSGALITATFALEQGREVFAVPGMIDDELSEGPHNLIKQGAHLVTSAEDVFEVFRFNPQVAQRAPSPAYSLPESYAVIIDFCHQPRTFEELMHSCQVDAGALHQMLFDLQLEGLIEQNHAGLWQKT